MALSSTFVWIWSFIVFNFLCQCALTVRMGPRALTANLRLAAAIGKGVPKPLTSQTVRQSGNELLRFLLSFAPCDVFRHPEPSVVMITAFEGLLPMSIIRAAVSIFSANFSFWGCYFISALDSFMCTILITHLLVDDGNGDLTVIPPEIPNVFSPCSFLLTTKVLPSVLLKVIIKLSCGFLIWAMLLFPKDISNISISVSAQMVLL